MCTYTIFFELIYVFFFVKERKKTCCILQSNWSMFFILGKFYKKCLVTTFGVIWAYTWKMNLFCLNELCIWYKKIYRGMLLNFFSWKSFVKVECVYKLSFFFIFCFSLSFVFISKTDGVVNIFEWHLNCRDVGFRRINCFIVFVMI